MLHENGDPYCVNSEENKSLDGDSDNESFDFPKHNAKTGWGKKSNFGFEIHFWMQGRVQKCFTNSWGKPRKRYSVKKEW